MGKILPVNTGTRHSIKRSAVCATVILFAGCSSPGPKLAEPVPVAQKSISVEDQLVTIFAEQALATKVSDRGVIVYIPGTFFEFGNAELSFVAREKIRFFASVLEKEFVIDRRIAVEGHTDSTGSEEFNLSLSRRRAEAATDELVFSGIDQDRIEMNWYGESAPVAANDTAQGRARNRRVEFIVLDASDDRSQQP